MPKVVRISEEKLVNMIDNLVAEEVETRKAEWLNEQKSAKESLLESRLAELEGKVGGLSK
jgi:hypothetical protein|tara:strand:+ start:2119 stop:2298 length:180 start_codon:yes stop_codon:yes gene_type:complete